MGTAQDVLRLASSHVGYNPKDDPDGCLYGRWFRDITGEPYYAQRGVAYCAMASSYWLAHSGVSCSGFPGAYCPWILEAGYREGTGVDWKGGCLQPGDVVLFDWQHDGVADHVGLVEYNRGSTIQTIEGNTSDDRGRSGVVARKSRALSTICGAIRPRYDASPTPAPTGRIDEDGWIGRQTVWAWGEQMRCDHVDYIRDQWSGNARYLPRLVAVSWDHGDGDWLIHAVQRRVGAHQDGHLGPQTIAAMQRWLGVAADGILGPITAVAIQRAINEGRWA